jgi:DnaJ-class molecular chaperone
MYFGKQSMRETGQDKESFYKLLDLPVNASSEEIKKAYRKMSLKYHPDKNPGNVEAKEMFCKISAAFEVLGDPDKKRNYDMGGTGTDDEVEIEDILKKMFFGMGMGGMGGMNMGGMGFNDDSMENVFSEMGGGEPRIHIFTRQGMHPMSSSSGIPGFGQTVNEFPFKQNMQKPSPIIKTLEIKIEQVLTGVTMPIEIERWLIENGLKLYEKETIYVNVPKGIDDNEMIMLREKGNSLGEDCKGDIKVFIKVVNQSEFLRNGLNLIYEKTIQLKEALCGFSFEMRYLNGKHYTINNNRGNIIPPHFVKVIPNMGIERDGNKGALHIHFKVVFPETLTSEQIDRLVEIL